jgi:hypothetical protein
MSWTAPQVTRIDEPFVADERTMLEGLLEWHRATLLRWLYGHMIEEYARHNGHADLLRQCIDGATGS